MRTANLDCFLHLFIVIEYDSVQVSSPLIWNNMLLVQHVNTICSI